MGSTRNALPFEGRVPVDVSMFGFDMQDASVTLTLHLLLVMYTIQFAIDDSCRYDDCVKDLSCCNVGIHNFDRVL